jgi:hypothetical protein
VPCLLGLLSCGHWVRTASEECARGLVPFTCIGQCHKRIFPTGRPLFLALKLIGPAPELAATRSNPDS